MFYIFYAPVCLSAQWRERQLDRDRWPTINDYKPINTIPLMASCNDPMTSLLKNTNDIFFLFNSCNLNISLQMLTRSSGRRLS